MRTADLFLTGARPYDVETGAAGHAVDVLVEGGTITEIGPDLARPDGVPVLDAAGATVLPGLIDAHFHAYAMAMDELIINATPLSLVAINATRRLSQALARGFTTVRDVAGGDIGLAGAADRGLFASPDYFFTGPALSQTAGHGDDRRPDLDLCAGHSHMCEVVDGVDAVRAAARRRFLTGAHAIKVMTGGGVISAVDRIEYRQYSHAEIAAVCEEAANRDSYVCAHAYTPASVALAVKAGVTSVEHGNLIDRATAELIADREAYLVPTLACYSAMDRRGAEVGLSEFGMDKNRMVLERGQDAVRLALEAGVRVGFGTDLMGDLHTEQLDGLRLQVEAVGLAETIRSATAVNAELMGLSDRGALAPGYLADLLLLPGDVTERPDLLWDAAASRTVIQRGRVVAGGAEETR